MYGRMYRTNSRSPRRLNTGIVYQPFVPGRLLAAEVVGHRLVERGDEVGIRAHELVVDRHRVGDEARTTARTRVEAEQAHEVGAVGVERERVAADLVAAGRGIADVATVVGDVAEQVALGVLRPGRAEMGADAPVDLRRAFLVVAVDGNATDEDDATTVDEHARETRQLGAERREREVVAGDVEHVLGDRLGVHERGVELGDVRVREPVHVAVGEVVAPPLAVGFERFERGHVDGRHRDPPFDGAACGPRTSRPGSASVASPCS